MKLSKMANFSDESGSDSGSNFIGPFQESESYTNINFHEILLKTHYLVKFRIIVAFWISLTGIWQKWPISQLNLVLNLVLVL